MLNIGVLGFQGSVEEHLDKLNNIPDVNPIKVKKKEDLVNLDGLILPGGESTTIGKLLKNYSLIEPIKDKVKKGMWIWGTCAGMILLAKNIVNDDTVHLGLMDIDVRRNAYGRQMDSFKTKAIISEVNEEKEIPLVFIRAPYIEKVKKNVDVLLKLDDHIVGVREDNMLATSFHPELTEDQSFHRYFVDLVRKA